MSTPTTQGLTPVAISPVEDIVADMRAGRMVILIDEEDRENEGDLVLAADHVTPEGINFMARFGRGLICLTLTRERCELLKLPPMATRNGTQYATAFTVSIEAAVGVTTGISAADRARTVQAAVAKNAQVSDLGTSSPQTAVHLVTLLEEMPVQETIDGVADLRSHSLPVGGIIVNMTRPPVLADDQLAEQTKLALRRLASAVAVVTCRDGQRRHAMTATAVPSALRYATMRSPRTWKRGASRFRMGTGKILS